MNLEEDRGRHSAATHFLCLRARLFATLYSGRSWHKLAVHVSTKSCEGRLQRTNDPRGLVVQSRIRYEIYTCAHAFRHFLCIPRRLFALENPLRIPSLFYEVSYRTRPGQRRYQVSCYLLLGHSPYSRKQSGTHILVSTSSRTWKRTMYIYINQHPTYPSPNSRIKVVFVSHALTASVRARSSILLLETQSWAGIQAYSPVSPP
jgi:hypothetical protein